MIRQTTIGAANVLLPFQGCQRPVERFVRKAQFGGHFLERSGNVINAGFVVTQSQKLQNPFRGGTYLLEFVAQPQAMQATRQSRGEFPQTVGVFVQASRQFILRIKPDCGICFGDDVALVTVGEQRGFGKGFAGPDDMQRHHAAVGSYPLHAQSAARQEEYADTLFALAQQGASCR